MTDKKMTIEQIQELRLLELQKQHNDAMQGVIIDKKRLSDTLLIKACIDKLNFMCDTDNVINQNQRALALYHLPNCTKSDCIDFILHCKGYIYECLSNRYL
jgi:type II secretory pathway predicted ATPase ExeA